MDKPETAEEMRTLLISQHPHLKDDRKRSMKYIYRQERSVFTVASLANSSTAAALHNPPPTAHVVTAPVRGAATYKALGR